MTPSLCTISYLPLFRSPLLMSPQLSQCLSSYHRLLYYYLAIATYINSLVVGMKGYVSGAFFDENHFSLKSLHFQISRKRTLFIPF